MCARRIDGEPDREGSGTDGQRGDSKRVPTNTAADLIRLLSGRSPRDEEATDLQLSLQCPRALWRRAQPTNQARSTSRRRKATRRRGASWAAYEAALVRQTASRLAAAGQPDVRPLVERFRAEIGAPPVDADEDRFVAAATRTIWSVLVLRENELRPPPDWFSFGTFLCLLEVAVDGEVARDRNGARLSICLQRLAARLVRTTWGDELRRFAEWQLGDKEHVMDRQEAANDHVEALIEHLWCGRFPNITWPLTRTYSYLRTSLRNRILHDRRKAVVHRRFEDVGVVAAIYPDDPADHVGVVCDVRAAIALLSAAELDVVVRCDIEGWKAADLAREHGEKPDAVRKRRSRAHTTLRQLLDSRYGTHRDGER